MLLHRVITSFVLLGVVLGAVFGLSYSQFMVFIAVVISLAAWEWAALAGYSFAAGKFGYLIVLLFFMAVVAHSPVPMLVWLLLGIAWWLTALLLICTYPNSQRFWSNRFVLSITGLLLFLPGWQAFLFLRHQDYYAMHLLLLPGLVAAADIGAYFAGRVFGRKKLAVRVSPNKTWEGLFGGLLACAFLMVIVAWFFYPPGTGISTGDWGKLVGGALLIAAVSVVGDLFESMIKRFRQVKDSGNLLPGHGGMLDRIDGLQAAAPYYAMLLIQLGPEFT